MPGIYFHIPFCRKACNYCDFHFSTSLGIKSKLINALAKELEIRRSYLEKKELTSIYFGGGTPSLLDKRDLGLLFDRTFEFFSLAGHAEITLEANPDDITPAALREWLDLGINRLSIGLQSFNQEELNWMNRAHTAVQSVASVKMAQDKGFENISIDLIYGSKFQSPESWENTLQQAIGLGTTHISSYNLTIENKTALGSKHASGKEPAVNDELSGKQFILMVEMLEAAGFVQYEISNFGKPGFFAVHNSNYWKGDSYLGVGPSAHSFNGKSRQWNVCNNNAYVKNVEGGTSFFEIEKLSQREYYNEYVMTRLRTIWGCDVNEMRRLFGDGLTGTFEMGIKRYKDCVTIRDDIYTLNLKGKLIADRIASDLFAV